MSIRNRLRQSPALGWGVAGVLLVVAVYLAYRSFGSGANPYSFDSRTEDIVIRDRETGEEWTMKRGRMEAMLWERGKIDPTVGIPNPKTGKPTGFPKSDWESTIERIQRDQAAFAEAYGGRVPTTGGGGAARKQPPPAR